MLDSDAIGVLGGSFNPPHAGHRALVVYAMRRLEVARFRVLVSPQSPLKDAGDYTPLETRLEATRELFEGLPMVRVAPESDSSPAYAVNTIRRLVRRERKHRFVYVMGADAFAELHRWWRWREIVETIPIAVVSRPAHRLAPLNAPVARTYSRFRVREHDAGRLARMRAPAWCFLDGLNRRESSTEIRAARTPPQPA